MVIRIHNLSKWARLKPGDVLQLNGQHARKIRVEFNCPAPTRIDALEGDKMTFLAVVHGYEVLEFSSAAEVQLVCTSDDDVFFFTNDGDNIANENLEAVAFTKVLGRRAARNPELELMMFKAERRLERRLAAQRAEFETMLAAQREALGHDPETGEVIDDEVGDAAGLGSASDAKGGEAGAGQSPASGADDGGA